MAVDSVQYRVTPRRIILGWAWLLAVWYCAKLSPQIGLLDSAQYDTPQSKLRAISYWVELDSVQYDIPRSQAPGSMILCSISYNHWAWLCAVWYSAEPSWKKYDTAQSQAPQSIILHGVKQPNLRGKLHAVSYCLKSSSAPYDNMRSQAPTSMILRRVTLYWAESRATF